jgi:hypothetical protein
MYLEKPKQVILNRGGPYGLLSKKYLTEGVANKCTKGW